ncbi:MAG: DegT/DnrJ/EryC1/StrS family aminotransferase [Thermoguttaceae bacterium]|jgi:dTDP-4-amino-4,6-dideoxygalactose transaminase
MNPTATEPTILALPSDQDASGRTLGDEEIEMVTQALRSGTLTCTKGEFTRKFERQFAALLGVKYATAASSGTAAVHTAVAAIDPEPGDEVVTSPITDMGAITPILYQGAIPVFADVDPATCNVTADTIRAVLSRRTRAIIVTHLFGSPCDMPAIMTLARSRGIPVIEDCAQAFLARRNDSYVGTFGDIACFSLQQGKHITTGEGGLVTTNSPELARRMYLFINKAWGYGDPKPDHYFLALNYRMSELQGAVALAQLAKLPDIVRRRIGLANALTERIADAPGVLPPQVDAGAEHVYWRYGLRVAQDGPLTAVSFGAALKERGIACAPRYIQKPAFQCQIFREQRTFGTSRWPFTLARPEALDYRPERFCGTRRALDEIVVLPWNERYTEEHVAYVAQAIQEAAAQGALGPKSGR